MQRLDTSIVPCNRGDTSESFIPTRYIPTFSDASVADIFSTATVKRFKKKKKKSRVLKYTAHVVERGQWLIRDVLNNTIIFILLLFHVRELYTGTTVDRFENRQISGENVQLDFI